MEGTKPQALQRLKIVECAQFVAAPLIGRMMADFGAEVIHVEHPIHGDQVRRFGFTKDGTNPWWKYYSRNKKCITLDISKVKGRELLLQLLKDADVFIENFRPGRLEEWNIHYDDLAKMNPRLIMVRVTGFGQNGPYSSQPGFGTLLEAMSGFAAMVGEADGPPTLPPFPLADHFAGLYGLFATMFAIYHRDVMGNGKGQVIDVSIWEPLFAMLGPNALAYELTGEPFKRMGSRAFTSAPRNIYMTRDKRWIAIAGSSQTTTARLFEAMGQPALINDPKFKTNEDRVKNVEALDAIVGKWMTEHDSKEVLKILNEAEVPVGPVMDISDIMKDPHAQLREMVIQAPDEDRGRVMMEGIFPKLSLTPGVVNHTGKRLGADNQEIFAGRLGLSKDEMAELAKQKVI